jgi:hypothetical protein
MEFLKSNLKAVLSIILAVFGLWWVNSKIVSEQSLSVRKKSFMPYTIVTLVLCLVVLFGDKITGLFKK